MTSVICIAIPRSCQTTCALPWDSTCRTKCNCLLMKRVPFLMMVVIGLCGATVIDRQHDLMKGQLADASAAVIVPDEHAVGGVVGGWTSSGQREEGAMEEHGHQFYPPPLPPPEDPPVSSGTPEPSVPLPGLNDRRMVSWNGLTLQIRNPSVVPMARHRREEVAKEPLKPVSFLPLIPRLDIVACHHESAVRSLGGAWGTSRSRSRRNSLDDNERALRER